MKPQNPLFILSEEDTRCDQPPPDDHGCWDTALAYTSGQPSSSHRLMELRGTAAQRNTP
jgi:hypothetical protein